MRASQGVLQRGIRNVNLDTILDDTAAGVTGLAHATQIDALYLPGATCVLGHAKPMALSALRVVLDRNLLNHLHFRYVQHARLSHLCAPCRLRERDEGVNCAMDQPTKAFSPSWKQITPESHELRVMPYQIAVVRIVALTGEFHRNFAVSEASVAWMGGHDTLAAQLQWSIVAFLVERVISGAPNFVTDGPQRSFFLTRARIFYLCGAVAIFPYGRKDFRLGALATAGPIASLITAILRAGQNWSSSRSSRSPRAWASSIVMEPTI